MMDNILKYQELDARLRAIEVELSNTEERKKTRVYLQYLKESEENLKKMEGIAADLNAKYATLKKQYESNVAFVEEYSLQVDKSLDEDELNYLGKKLADLSKTIAAIEREAAEIAEEAEKIAKQFDDYKTKLPSVKKKYGEAKEKFDSVRKTREPEMIDIQRKKAALEKKIDPSLLAIYKELKTQNVLRPFVPLEGADRCGGCRVDLPKVSIATLEEKGFVRCGNCHRIIYKP